MNDTANEETEDDILSYEISDELLEAAACVEKSGALTQIAWCTVGVCPGG